MGFQTWQNGRNEQRRGAIGAVAVNVYSGCKAGTLKVSEFARLRRPGSPLMALDAPNGRKLTGATGVAISGNVPTMLKHQPNSRARPSLADDPAFAALVRDYAARSALPPVCVAPVMPHAGIADAVRGRWFVLRLRPGREIEAIDWLANRTGLPFYLPLHRRISYRASGRCRSVSRALFVGYGFVRALNIWRFRGIIAACPLAHGLLYTRDDTRDGLLPAHMTIPDDMIEAIKVRENTYDDLLYATLGRADREWSHQRANRPGVKRCRSDKRQKAACREVDSGPRISV